MRIPASKLVSSLTPGTYEVRAEDFSGFDAAMPYTEVLARAVRGEIEAVASKSGRIKYLRMLPERERQPAPELQTAMASAGASVKESNSTVTARTNIGVYRQEVESTAQNEWGMPTRIVIGHTYAFCALRSAGI